MHPRLIDNDVLEMFKDLSGNETHKYPSLL
jgi:hypothetical protein